MPKYKVLTAFATHKVGETIELEGDKAEEAEQHGWVEKIEDEVSPRDTRDDRGGEGNPA